MIRIEVVYALAAKQYLFSIEITSPVTVKEAILSSGLLQEIPHLNLEKQALGIFGQPCHLYTLVRDGDRIELYRPLIFDPKEARQKRVRENSKINFLLNML